MGLKEYKRKRNPKLTPEPFSSPKKTKKKKSSLIFVIQKHAASHLHYDFRLEVDGVLKSWAVPKGPSLNPADKRLAIMVEDHPYDYHDFEGTIPTGSYGAGTVMVWDEGTYSPLDANGDICDEKDFKKALDKGHASFNLEGKKLHGRFSLIKLKKAKKNEWLLMKANDSFADTIDILKQDASIISNRSMKQIADNAPFITSKEKKSSPTSRKKKVSLLKEKIKPMLAYLTDSSFDGEDWLFEIKWDGFRAIAELDGNNVELYSRTFKSFNDLFSPVVDSLKSLDLQATIFDGEIVVVDDKGRSDFQSLQNYQRTREGNLRYYIFDLLFFRGEDLRELPLIERKDKLKKLLPKSSTSLLQYSDHIIDKGKKAFEAAEKLNLEGIIAKRMDSLYTSKRSRDWLKVKTHARQEAVICGFTAPQGSRQKFGSLILGVYDEGDLHYIGHVGGGFNSKLLTEVMAMLQPLIVKESPFKERIKANSPVTWVKPKLVCEISFAEWTQGNHVRQPIFLGIRPDKEPKQVKKEEAIPIEQAHPKKKTKSKTTKSNSKTASIKSKKHKELPLTHLDKVFWPKEKYTKGDLIEYYREMSPYLLPYLKDRPESLLRFPHGIGEKGFFQKNVEGVVPEWIPTVPVQHEDKVIRYLMIQDVDSLLYTINLGCIDLNPFNSRIQSLNNPDYLILDLDPEDIPFEKVIETAQMLHELLESIGIPCYCKTSGATGLHIYVPMGAQYNYEQVKNLAQLLALIGHERLPDITSVVRQPKNRQKRVYIDFLQNNFGQTLAAPYCVRPRLGATVSTPLEWKEVKKGLDPHDFNIKTILKRVKKKGDLFGSVLGKGIDLAATIKKLQKL